MQRLETLTQRRDTHLEHRDGITQRLETLLGRRVTVISRLFVVSLVVAHVAFPTTATPATAAGPTCRGVPATIVGDDGANLIRGTNGRDVIVAGAGNDKILGRGGNDLICAGPGNDVVVGGDGRDRIFGESGNDRIKGGPGFDTLDGGPGTDACYVNGGGGREIACEGTDLRVTVTGPTSVVSGTRLEFLVTVKNVGAKPAAGVVLELERTGTNVSCGDGTETIELGKMKPGSWERQRRWVECGVDPGGPHLVTMNASATTTSPESDLSNNAAVAITEVLPNQP